MDHYTLINGPTSLDIGSYVLADPGPDFDFGSLFQAAYIQNPVSEGGLLAYETNSVRRFKFPLRLASSGAFTGGLDGLEQLVRRLAKPGGTIDLLPEGVASPPVRFDIIDGRLDDNYSIYIQRLGRREATLELDVMPFGYWPTSILLASAVSASYEESLALSWNPASIIGDAPALAIIGVHASPATYITAAPTFGGAYANGQQYLTDGMWWSLARPSGATSFMSPSDFYLATNFNVDAQTGSSLIRSGGFASDGLAPFGTRLIVDWYGSYMDQLRLFAVAKMTSSQAQMYRGGRYRVFGTFRNYSNGWYTPSVGIPAAGSAVSSHGVFFAVPIKITMDETWGDSELYAPLASNYPIATVLPVLMSSSPNIANPTPWYDMPLGGDGGLGGATWPNMLQIDLGEHVFPPGPSGYPGPWMVRLWAAQATAFTPFNTRLEFMGLRFEALSGQAGVLTNGMVLPSMYHPMASNEGAFFTNNFISDTVVWDSVANITGGVYKGTALAAGSNIAQPASGFFAELRRSYLGPLPQLVGTEMQLDVGTIDRAYNRALATAGVGRTSRNVIAASVSYRPRFSFLRGF